LGETIEITHKNQSKSIKIT